MNKIIVFSLLFNIVLCDFVYANDSFTVYQHKYSPVFTSELLNNLSFAEKQIFSKVYSKDSVEDRIERLELKVYGAIQDGKITTRINNIKNDVTNVSQGGKGLQYVTKLFDLAGNTITSDNSNFSNNMYNDYSNQYSHRLPPVKRYRSSRIDIDSYNNYLPYKNDLPGFTIGTGVKILKDD